MKPSEVLEKMLKEEILPEIEEHIDDLFEMIAASKTVAEEDKAALEEARELREEFMVMLGELENGDLDEEECEGIIEELNEMREDEDEEA
ncbi:MAG: hypothetical protein JXK05_09765 [Campylobacterales bacterium]|nr:hypothetical protein [Campylobacterales bacterium]